jgi:K+-sensing histidine kinase KdpD
MTGDCEQLVSDIFHELSQPLTTLNCCLEGMLKRKGAAARSQQDMRTALQQAGKVIRLISDLRQLVGSGRACDPSHRSSLEVCLKESVGDLLAGAERTRVKRLMFCGAPVEVPIESSQLKHALARLIEFILNCSCPQSELNIKAFRANNEIVLTMRTSKPRNIGTIKFQNTENEESRALRGRIAVAIARRTFESVHGRLEVCHRSGLFSIQVRLPTAFQEPAQPLAWASRCCG